jgi:Uma2 family endonuclease
MSTTTKLITADELLVMPHQGARGNKRVLELIRGELKIMSPTGGTHGIICMEVGTELTNFVRGNNLGRVFGAETGFIVERNPDSVLGVDVAFVSHERLKDVDNLDKFMPFAPDLAVEVLSPTNTAQEMDEKVSLYFAGGARAVWVFNPKRRTVAAYTSPFDVRILGAGDTLDGGDVLPGLSLELSKLFSAIKS